MRLAEKWKKLGLKPTFIVFKLYINNLLSIVNKILKSKVLNFLVLKYTDIIEYPMNQVIMIFQKTLIVYSLIIN